MPREHTEAVKRNILPRSVDQRLPHVFREWRFTGATKDFGEAIETCQLCEQEQLRYHFKIRNDKTHSHLWVGSQCILKFGVAVYDGGVLLSPDRARRKLHGLIAEMRLKACLLALEQLAIEENNDILRTALKYYREHGYLSPKLAFVVLWRLEANRIDHSPSFFKVSLRRSKYQDDLENMPTSHVHTIWPALSTAQRATAIERGHAPPPE
jgi:hypothetical protein